MDFRFSDDQAALQSLLEGYFAKAYPFSQSLADRTLPLPQLPGLWSALAGDLGVLGAALPSRFGGFDGGAIAHMLIAEALGKALAIIPYYSSVAAGCAGLTQAGTPRADALVEAAAAGQAILAPAFFEPGRRYSLAPQTTLVARDGGHLRLSGTKILVHDAPFATHFVVNARDGATGELLLLLVDAAGNAIRHQAYRTLDGHAAADIHFDAHAIPPDAVLAQGDAAQAMLAHMQNVSRLALAAELLGCLRTTLRLTIEYARQRRQFGVSIGSFQVLQHRMVDAYMDIERAAAMLHMAALKLDAGAPDAPLMAAAAMVKILQACRFTVPAAVQIHGGMGVSDETPVTHYVRRITALERRLGTIDAHIALFDQAAGGMMPLVPLSEAV